MVFRTTLEHQASSIENARFELSQVLIACLVFPTLLALAIIWLGTPDPVTSGHAALALEVVR